MTVSWTVDKNVKLFLGVLEQLKAHKVKVDNAKLAEYMGPGCTARAVETQIAKLKKQAEDSSNGHSPSGPSTPVSTPRKRTADRGSKTNTPIKKAKASLPLDPGGSSEADEEELFAGNMKMKVKKEDFKQEDDQIKEEQEEMFLDWADSA
ncbi:hypothetical protein ARAM_007560 [Aspergillus rambellii]|uniref:Uncharacterized protein n=1 Tax=Aspergillus rambellii TaxID=308745 RepID=A0A0F8XAL4_9EURO|nr:hypothetical protein ARAM_007560 [Aspergillus rambellii]